MHTSDTTPLGAAPAASPSAAAARRTLGARATALRARWTDSRAGTLGLLGILVATGVLYCWNLTANGYANSFYSAAVQAGSVDWTAFFYGSSDAGNSITVDKPPASLWVMALSVRLFGLNSAAILLPQVVMGIASVFVLNRSVRRVAGEAAGLIAAAALALTPVAVLMFRFNNPDALLVLLMTLGAWATVRAIEKGSIRWMVLVGVLIGFAFLTKTLQAFLVVPFFALAFLVCADTTLRRRILGTFAAGLALVVAGGWWVAIVELVPEQWRPYIGGSQTNSFLELTFGYNGLGRLSGDEVGSVGGGGGFGSGAGIGRLFGAAIGGQISWLIPAALLLTVGALWLGRRAPRTDLVRASLLVWGGWFLTTAVVFSFMQGIFHEYYTVALAPAIAAMVGLGAGTVWRHRESFLARLVLALAAAGTGVWGFVLLQRQSDYGIWLAVLVLVTGLLAAVGLLLASRFGRRTFAGVLVLVALSAGAGQAAYAASTVTTAKTGSIITAGPSSSGGFGAGPTGMSRGGQAGQMPGGFPGGGQMPGGSSNGGSSNGGGPNGGSQNGGAPGQGSGSFTPPTGGGAPGGSGGEAGSFGGAPGGGGGGMGGLLNAEEPDAEVVAALQEDADQYTWVAAAIGSQNAAGLQLASEEPVMALGGFNGSDPSPTLAQFQQYVADGEIHYVLAGEGFGGQNGGSNSASEITQWVAENYAEVTIGDTTFYDLTQPLSGTDAETAATLEGTA